MIKTNKQVVEEIMFEVLGGMWQQDTRLDPRFVLGKINDRRAFLVKKAMYEQSNLENVVYANGSFFTIYANLPVSLDSVSGLRTIDLPDSPIGLPRERSFRLFPSANYGGMTSTRFKAMPRHEMYVINSLYSIPNTIFYSNVGKKLYLTSSNKSLINPFTVLNLEMASSGGSMDGDIDMPADMVDELKTSIVKELRLMLGIGEDRTTDGHDVKEIV